MRTDGVYRKMKCGGNIPGGLAFHTKVIDCNFFLRFHIELLSVIGGRATEMATLPVVELCLDLKELYGFGQNEFGINTL